MSQHLNTTKKNKTSKALSNDTSPASGTGTKKQANYLEDEDYYLITGVSQKSEVFWTRVLEICSPL